MPRVAREGGRTQQDVRQIIQSLDALLRDPAQAAIRRTFTLWIKSLLRRKAGSHSIHDMEQINDLLEAGAMLEERIEFWIEEAARKGMQQGMEQGRLVGESRLLSKLLERRFGPLPASVSDRLAQATEAQLDAWADAVLSAATLEAVFALPH